MSAGDDADSGHVGVLAAGELSRARGCGQIDDEARVAEYINHAFHLAISGRPGPVVLALPEDMLRARAAPVAIAPAAEIQAHPGAGDMETLRRLLSKARRPLMILGGRGWHAGLCPVILSFP